MQEKHIQLLAQLLRNIDIEVEDLPYTIKFEDIYQRFITATSSVCDRHEVWASLFHIKHPADIDSPAVAPLHEPDLHRQQPQVRDTQPPIGNQDLHEAPLFSQHPNVIAQQPWRTPQREASDTATEARERLLADIANSRLGNMEQRLGFILQRYPETRDNDTSLAIRYWKYFQSDIIVKCNPLTLDVLFDLHRIDTISRVRRHIQNRLKLFTSLRETHRLREFAQIEFHEYLAAGNSTEPEIRFFLDETGNEGQKTYTGIAGVCVMNWKQYEMHWASLNQWRQNQGWPETIHFVEMGNALQGRATALLDELGHRRSGLLFLGYALPSRGQTHKDLLSLFIQLILDALRYMDKIGCLNEPRSLKIIKEADIGFDNIYLENMEKFLGEQISLEFPGRVVCLPIDAIPKGREVMLECADLIAGGMQRRALMKGHNPKDILAETVFNVTGFDDLRDNGTVFKHY